MSGSPDDLPRLIHEALEELGWDSNAASVAERVRRLDIGLPAEDEFSVICAWLGRVELLHKLDQHQVPKMSKESFQVPDLLARFDTQKNNRPLLIEVKTGNENTLSFKPEYLERLQNYSTLMGMPLLIAWKYHSFWTLFEARHLKLAVKNFNISFHDAMAENLLTVLAGDVAYEIGPGSGVHLRAKKDELLSAEKLDSHTSEHWKMHIDKVEFTNRDGEVVDELSSETQSLLTVWDLEERQDHDEDHIWLRYTAPTEVTEFGHRTLVRLLDWVRPSGQKISWRRVARKEKLSTIEDLRSALSVAFDEKIIKYVFYLQPRTAPDFLNETELVNE
ncbi:hypothetical protein [Pseudooceanicola sp. MF1-13]|uniref:hypothetical protein n=1 Tax=Pseudooceanicola sp. MF1-13 TaxID=3379095 RepID=UPI003892CA55